MYFLLIIRCSHKKKHRKGSRKNSLLYSEVPETGDRAYGPGPQGKHQVVSRQKTGMKGEHWSHSLCWEFPGKGRAE